MYQYIDMVCIYCGSTTGVTNSRTQKELNQVWRRRRCLSCGSNFTTHEVLDLASTIAVKNLSRKLEPFSRDRLFISILESCKHRASPVSDAGALCQTVLRDIRGQVHSGTITPSDIAKTVIKVLGRFDKTALTIYKAYHTTQ